MRVILRLAEHAEGPPNCKLRYAANGGRLFWSRRVIHRESDHRLAQWESVYSRSSDCTSLSDLICNWGVPRRAIASLGMTRIFHCGP